MQLLERDLFESLQVVHIVGFAPRQEQAGEQMPAVQDWFLLLRNPGLQVVQFVFKSADESLQIVHTDGLMPRH